MDSNHKEIGYDGEMKRVFNIPPGVEEIGVLTFERLDSTEDDVRFLLPFKKYNFIFDVKLSE